jgi:hypothetical protein
MHHKYIVADNVVYLGSYNFTFNAQNNYETLVRINNRSVSRSFIDESYRLFGEEYLWGGGIQFAYADGIFRCGRCEQLYPSIELGQDNSTWMECKRCNNKNSVVGELQY